MHFIYMMNNCTQPWEVMYLHYPHFIDENIEALRSPDNLPYITLLVSGEAKI